MKKTVLSGITTVLMAGVLAAGVCCAGYASRNADGKWFKNSDLSTWHWADKSPSDINKPNDDNSMSDSSDGAVVGNGENNGVEIVAAKLPREAYAANGIDPKADTAYKITATVSPDNADDKTLDWAISWIDGSSSWANGKTVTDYGTITPTSDGALTANFVCKQNFGAQIVITATSRDNPQAKGTLTVDYRKKLTSSTTGIFDGNTSSTKVWNIDNTLFDGNTVFNDNFGVGTLDDVVKSHKMTITTHSALRSKLSGTFTSSSQQTAYTATREYNGVNHGVLNWDNLFVPPYGAGSGWSTIEGLFSFCSDEIDYGVWDILSSQYNKLRPCFINSATDFVITIKTELEHGGTYTASYNVNVLDSSLKIRVENVDVSDSIII